MTTPVARYAWLPNELAEIARVAGLDAALRLAEARGGEEVHIPVKPKPGHWLIETVGEAAARKICAYYASGVSIRLPLGPTGSIAEIRRVADRMIAEGKSSAQIARAVGYTTRAIEKRKAKARAGRVADPRQKSLF